MLKNTKELLENKCIKGCAFVLLALLFFGMLYFGIDAPADSGNK
jgi:hypothetical protein